MERFDFLVIGAGIAGLSAAIRLADAGTVLVVTKEELAESNTAYAQGGIAVAMGGEQDVALHMWTRLVEQHDLEIELLLQMHGLLVFGVLVSTRHYAQFYIDLNEALHREHEPETADALRDYYLALVPPRDQPEIGPEGLPVISRYLHLRDVTIMSAGHSIKLPLWRGKLSEVDAFVMGATASE